MNLKGRFESQDPQGGKITMKYIWENGIRIRYEKHGTGTPMIWLHGLFGNWKVWEETMTFFMDHYCTISYDARGHGDSEVPENQDAYSQEIMVEDMFGVFNALNIDRAVIGGHSMGANVALNFAIRYPERCLACIPVGAGAGSAQPKWRGEIMRSMADTIEQEGMVKAVELAKNLPGWEQLAIIPSLWEKVKRDILDSSPIGIANTIRGVQMKRSTIQQLEPQLRQLRVKTLIIVGELDTPCLEPSKLIAQFTPEAVLEIIEKSGHFTHMEAPEKFMRVIENFLTH
jgi:pimeloyl-ACP methyl ester carboxylesterase